MHFIVDRKTWYRGQGNNGSKLLLYSGERCCVGFRCQAAGIPDDAVLSIPSVHSIGIFDRAGNRKIDSAGGSVDDGAAHRAKLSPEYSLMPWFSLETSHTTVIGKIYEANDEPSISEGEREAKLKVLFEELGDTVEFIN